MGKLLYEMEWAARSPAMLSQLEVPNKQGTED